MTTEEAAAKGPETDHSLKQLTQVVYALQAASFLVGLSIFAAIIVNYVKREVVLVGFAVLAADAIWFLYRIIKGWLRLSEGKPMYTDAPK